MNPMKTLVNRMENLLSTGKEADVRFLVGTGEAKKEFSAHKAILTTASDVFERMFQFDANNGNGNRIIEVPDVTPEVFQVLLNYIYVDKLDGLNQDNVTAVLYAAKKYNIAGLINACLNCILDTDGALIALNQARFYHEKHEKLANYDFWNIEEAEGLLEFGKNGLVTAKNLQGRRAYGIINALKPLLIKELGIAYYEFKLIDFPQHCNVILGIGQQTMPSSTFYVFKKACEILTYNVSRPSNGDVFGCIVKFSSKEIFVTRNGGLYYNGYLQDIVELDKSLDMTLAIKLFGEGCSVQLGRIEMSENEGECPF